MKTDSLFYQLFLQFPSLFFYLLGLPPDLAADYQFTSREVKQLAFRCDGLFFPLKETETQPFYLVEVQFQPDPDFYYRLFSELLLFLRQYKPQSPWRLVVIYPSRSTERIDAQQFGPLVNLPNLTRIYLDELTSESDNLEVGLLKLITANEQTVVNQAQTLVRQAKQQLNNQSQQKNLIELVEKILIYKLPSQTREEIEAMFSTDELKQTRFYQDVKAVGKAEGKAEGRAEGKQELIKRQLRRKINSLSPELESQINQLNINQLESLAEALLDFQTESDLRSWLEGK